jgi:murein DD-endopeptidase MepM/ murein hydrolase activator NlpD
VDGKSGTATVEVVDPLNIPAFSRPFAAGVVYRVTNYHDHDIPRSFFDNGRKLSFWGETYDIVGYEGHQGYDFRMDEGTPILAVANGTVVTTSHAAFFCPLLDQQIPADGNGYLLIEHPLPGGVRVRTLYAHLSRKDVTAGQTVTAGQQLGLSGNVGCSLNPHLHFEAVRQTQTNNGQPAPIDPWGWEGAGTDPWVAHAEGAASIRLWKPGEAPDLFVRYSQPVNQAGGNLFFGLTAIQPMGYRDDQNPNNEYVEISRDPAFAPATLDIGGATIRTRAGTVYTFPAGTTLSAASPTVRVYTGAGTGSASVQYMGRTAGVYHNVRECVGVYNAAGALRNQVAMGVNGCS